MSAFIDHTGQVFDRLTVIRYSHKNGQRQSFWLTRCECGNHKVVMGQNLRKAVTRSCGCIAKEVSSTHHVPVVTLDAWKAKERPHHIADCHA